MRGETRKVKQFWGVMLKCVIFVLRETKSLTLLKQENVMNKLSFWKDRPGKEHLLLVPEYSCVCVRIGIQALTCGHMAQAVEMDSG